MKDIYEIVLKLKYFCHCNERKISTSCQINLAELRGIKAMGEEVVTCSDFSKKVNLSPSRSSRIVDNLVKKGLLLRKVSKEDRRATLLYLTKKGWELKLNINREEKEFEKLLLSELSREDIEIVRKGLNLLEKIMRNNAYTYYNR